MRNLRWLLRAGAGFVAGLGVTFGLAALFPSQDWAAFIVGFLTFLAVPSVISAVSDRRWLSVLAFLTCAVAMMSAVNLPGALALSERGNPLTVTVTEHEVTHPWVSGARTTTHRYILQRADGSPLGEDLVSRSSRYDDLDEGDSLTVLVDPDGNVPVEVASEITPAMGIGLLVFGVGGMALVLVLTAVLPPRKTKPRRGKH